MKAIPIGLALVAFGLSPAAAQDMAGTDISHAKPACVKAVVVPGFERWGTGTPAPQLAIGSFSSVALAPADSIFFAPPLNRAAKPGDMGGVAAITIKAAGTYRIAIDPAAWIDVIGPTGQRLESVAHAHGPDCSGIGKIVDYALPAGDYVVQFSATKAVTLKVMVIAK